MSENRRHVDELIVRWLTGFTDAEDKQLLEAWLKQSDENQLYYNRMQKVWNSSENIGAFESVDVTGDYDLVAAKLGFAKGKKGVLRSFFTMRNVAAVLLPLIAVGIAFTLYQTTPGFGKWVACSSGTDVECIVLPDNSIVDLNSQSRLVYDKKLDGRQRKVKLEGEGFFKVAKNADQPFVVEVGGVEVEVLGTAFYLEEEGVRGETNLIVTEGRVLFSSGDDQLIVSKGESAMCLNGKLVKLDNICYNDMAWRTGLIEFDKTGLDEVVRTILDYFSDQVDRVEIQSKKTDRVITTKFSSPSLEEVLVELRIHFDKKFTLHDRKLIISD